MNKREKILGTITGLVICGALILTTIVDPQLHRLKELDAQKAQLELRATKIQKDLYLKNHVEGLYAQIQAHLSQEYDETRETSLFIRELRDIYTKLRLKPKLVAQEITSRHDEYTILALRIDISANSKQILRFIHAIECSPSPITIKRCELKADHIKGNISGSFIISKVIAVWET